MKNFFGCFGLLIVGGILGGALYLVGPRPDPAAEQAAAALKADPLAGRERAICKGLQAAVRARLKAPATAQFDSCWNDTHVAYAGGGLYTSRLWVDSQNGFGALVRSYWDAIVQAKPDETVITDLKPTPQEFLHNLPE